MSRALILFILILMASPIIADEYDFDKMFAGENDKNTVTQQKGTVEVDDFMKTSSKERGKVREIYNQKYTNVNTGPIEYVMVKADRIAGLAGGYVKKLTLSGGSGNFNSNGSSSMVSIFKGYDGKLAGTYSYVAEFDNGKFCSGSFQVSGNKPNVYLQIFDNCSGSVNEH